ncbi:Trehalose utilization [Thalassoglobus neptunius]|uniref:Trehalose utilization n=1 Tax=Thalassoglobus neptunius TaxID=1938619 RepID=A0A5C5WZE5_9PLAN|nr:PVC-type heme-binding CxxCH protein [Thalassoglobus neptunius]TWT55263.1 Trehalose utilization [Thalassoglobus neptunius]
MRDRFILISSLMMLCLLTGPSALGKDLELLFLGDNGAHRPADRFAQLAPVLSERGIELKYTDDVQNLNEATLNQFDGLIVYANIDRIEKAQADALLKYVADGNAFIPLHCATYCFRNDPRIVALMGGQFLKHGGEEFSTVIVEPDIPLMKGFSGFESWDETYVHHLHNTENRNVVEVRRQGMQADGKTEEPWTWTRTHGDGRVFYTAWGHDNRTWSHPGFHNLVERGIRWACGDDPQLAGPFTDTERFDVPEMTRLPEDLAPFDYIEVGAKIPNYVPSDKWGTLGEALTTMQAPLPAEESIKHYVAPEGFHLELFASEQFGSDDASKKNYAGLVGKPIAMNWDERGRLWVCETIDYPNELMPENKGRDRIRICEDTDQDGRADKFTIFAENLSIPTSITFHNGGAIVQNGTETLWLKDTDGDDIADQRDVIISNWALVDTHGGVSQLRYGIDNWFWGMQGYNNSEPVIEATGEKQPGFRMGFWRFRLDDSEPPKVTDLEFIRSTDNNTWGLGISEEGLVFGSTANRNPSVFMPIPNRYYERVRGWGPQQLRTIADTYLFNPITDRIRQVDQHGGYTAAAGHALYTGRNYPQQWWNRTAFVCGPTGKLIGTFVLKPDGAGYTSTSPLNLVASDDEWSAPIAAEVGPDGNVWFLDWYNYIVQHNPTPQGFETGKGRAYESDLRDKKHGRIYRVVHEDTPTTAFSVLDRTDGPGLIDALRNTSYLVRLHAQRLLIEENRTDLIPELVKIVDSPQLDEIGLDPAAMHAIGVLQGLGYFTPDNSESLSLLERGLNHPAAGVRRLSLQSLPVTEQSVNLIESSGVLADANAQVRLAALLALSDQGTQDRAGKLVAERLLLGEDVNDQWLADAMTSAAAVHAVPFFERTAEVGAQISNDSPESLAKRQEVLSIVSEHFSRGRPSPEDLEAVLLAAANLNPELSSAVLTGLTEGWPSDYTIEPTEQLEQSLVTLVQSLPNDVKGRVIRLANLLGSDALSNYADEIVQSLLSTIRDDQQSVTNRLSAINELVVFQNKSDQVVTQLLDLITPQSPPEFSTGIMNALMNSTAETIGHQLAEKLRAFTPSIREAAIRVLLARPETTTAFLDGVEAGQIPFSDLSLDQKRALTEHPSRPIRRRAREIMQAGGGLPNADRQKVIEELLSVTHMQGDVELGKAVFTKHCAKCHKHGDLGEEIGPNLTGMVVHPKEELLVHILDPSRSVEGNFRLYTVVTIEGRIFSGMMAAESRTSIELIDTEAKRRTLPREDIEELLASPKSLMPEGFEKQMTPEELGNLLEFLTNKGKYIPIDLRKIATIASTTPMFYGVSPVERLVFSDWKPKVFNSVPFLLVDPKGTEVPNVVMLNGPLGEIPPKMPKQVEFPVHSPVKSIHVLGGIGGWSFPAHQEQTTSVLMKLTYSDGSTEDIELKNGVHFADYVRRIDVEQSEFAYNLDGRQVRYFQIEPARTDLAVERIELIKGEDGTAPIFMAITVETP